MIIHLTCASFCLKTLSKLKLLYVSAYNKMECNLI